MPYRSRKTTSDPVVSIQARATGSGHAADPLTVKRSDLAAAADAAASPRFRLFAPSCALSIMTYIVGTPMKIVTGGRSTSRSRDHAARGAKDASPANSTVAPAAAAHIHPLTMPCMWCNGRTWYMRSLGDHSHAFINAVHCAAREPCVCRTPLGAPVVPLV